MKNEIESLLTAHPFAPFTVTMSDGQRHEVRHPEMAMVGKHFLYVLSPDGEHAHRLYLLHITSLDHAEERISET